jgi:hypothetical protein
MTPRRNPDETVETGGQQVVARKPRRDWLTMAMWLAAVAAMVMFSCTVAARIWPASETELLWIPAVQGGDVPAAGELVRDAHPEISTVAWTNPAKEGDSLSALGERLDNPALDAQQRDPSPSDNQVIPVQKRWQIKFPDGTTEAEYARQLAALGIELGVLRPDGSVEYVTNPGTADAKRRTGRRADDKRLYWTWQRGDLSKADEILLQNAGVRVANDVVLHFCPQDTHDRLLALEKDFRKRQPIDILLTRFSLKRTFRGYEVYVEEQTTR